MDGEARHSGLVHPATYIGGRNLSGCPVAAVRSGWSP
jgi:hypothetical protein